MEAPTTQQLEVTNTNSPRFVIEIPKGDDKFIFSCPATATYQETFNAAMQMLLSIYDMSKQAPQVSQPSTVPVDGEKKDDQ